MSAEPFIYLSDDLNGKVMSFFGSSCMRILDYLIMDAILDLSDRNASHAALNAAIKPADMNLECAFVNKHAKHGQIITHPICPDTGKIDSTIIRWSLKFVLKRDFFRWRRRVAYVHVGRTSMDYVRIIIEQERLSLFRRDNREPGRVLCRISDVVIYLGNGLGSMIANKDQLIIACSGYETPRSDHNISMGDPDMTAKIADVMYQTLGNDLLTLFRKMSY